MFRLLVPSEPKPCQAPAEVERPGFFNSTLCARFFIRRFMSLRESLALLAASFRSRTRRKRLAIGLLCLFVGGLIIIFLNLI